MAGERRQDIPLADTKRPIFIGCAPGCLLNNSHVTEVHVLGATCESTFFFTFAVIDCVLTGLSSLARRGRVATCAVYMRCSFRPQSGAFVEE